MLIIMDGWGLGKNPDSDAIQHAKTPFVSSLASKYPHSTLVTCGTAVGLPEGQMGNSEVGHLNLGAGRIVYQDLERINVEIREGKFANNAKLLEAIRYAKDNGKKLHLAGLLSDGGVHSHIEHLMAITTVCAAQGLDNVLIHAFTDGRDTDPMGGIKYLETLLKHLDKTTGKVATIIGRYYAMDRDKRWERVKLAYDAMVNGIGRNTSELRAAMKDSYIEGTTDEFILPIINAGIPDTKVESGDVFLCFNFRTDRCREITEVLTQTPHTEFDMQPLALHYYTMTRYDHTYKNVEVLYEKDDLALTLGEVLSSAGKTQVRIAETEKYPHVSFFFSGGREDPYTGEKRLMVASPKVATYDLQPEMSAPEVTAKIVKEIEDNSPDFICLNFANADMVGHTGLWDAIIKAVETVDASVQQVVEAGLKQGYNILLTADHGNADYAVNDDGTPNTAHSLNLVPLFLISNEHKYKLNSGKLGDIAPTLLTIMGIEIPQAMTGKVLVSPI